MERILMILEVSQKQNYIFASKVLKENIQRSANIARVTSSEYFARVCPQDYDRDKNFVYSGGGHTVLQFPGKEEADRFARTVTRQVMLQYPGLELFVKQLPYDDTMSPGDNLNQLSRLLEIKKSRREHFFRTYAMGIEQSEGAPDTRPVSNNFTLPQGWLATTRLDLSDKDDNFLAIVHIDGNAMGARVQGIYDKCRDNWEECRHLLDQFSTEIDSHYRAAFDEMAQELADNLEFRYRYSYKKYLPLRKIIGAGDDICFITTGRQGLECAASFLRHLSVKRNSADGELYTACAGVVLVHKKYPFREAYELSEELCRNAKTFCSAYGGGISALDFHIEYSQLKNSLSEIRAEYVTEDGARLELRPLAVTGTTAVPLQRTYRFHTGQLRQLSRELNNQEKKDGSTLARSKVKSLRPYLHQGEIETAYALKKSQTTALLHLNEGRDAFYTDDKNVRRCLYFDTIELLDVTTLWKEADR